MSMQYERCEHFHLATLQQNRHTTEVEMCHNFPIFYHQNTSSSAKFENVAARLEWLTSVVLWSKIHHLRSNIIRVVRRLG